MTREDIGRTLAELRRRANMSRDEVAGILDKSPKTIGHWETGHAMPDANMLFILCKIYDADLNEAFGFTPKTKKSHGADESAPWDESEQQVMNLVERLTADQQKFLLAWLKVALEEDA